MGHNAYCQAIHSPSSVTLESLKEAIAESGRREPHNHRRPTPQKVSPMVEYDVSDCDSRIDSQGNDEK
jgi:hypothetical protein